MRTANDTVVLATVLAGIASGLCVWYPARHIQAQEAPSASRRASQDRQSASRPSRESASASQARMDAAFYEALYRFMCGDFEEAYAILDRAVDAEEPSENWHLYLPLYGRCFGIMTGTSKVDLRHSDKAQAFINRMRGLREPRASDLVKLAVILHIPREPVDIEPQLKAIRSRHPTSPWSEWAEWRLLKKRTDRLMREGSKAGFPGALSNMALAKKITLRLAAEPEPAKIGIMRKWMILRLREAVVGSVYDANESLQALGKIRSIGRSGQGEPQVPAFELPKGGILPGAMRLDLRVLSVIDGSYFDPVVTRQEVVWTYFEGLRRAKADLPAAIPRDKELFLEKTNRFLHRLRSFKARDLPAGVGK